MKKRKIIKKIYLIMAIIITFLSIIGNSENAFAQALPDGYSQVPLLEVLEGGKDYNGGKNPYIDNYNMFVYALESLGIYCAVDLYETMYQDHIDELKENMKDPEWLAQYSNNDPGIVYMYNGVPYYSDLLYDCMVFQTDPSTYELWQGNKVGNIPTPSEAWGNASNYCVTIGQEFVDAVKDFADRHIKNNQYYSDTSLIPKDNIYMYGGLINGTFTSNTYSNNISFPTPSPSQKTYKYTDLPYGTKAVVIHSLNIASAYIFRPTPYADRYTYRGYEIQYVDSGFDLGTDISSYITDWFGITSWKYNGYDDNPGGTTVARKYIDYMLQNPDLYNPTKGHIYINPSMPPCTIGGNNFNLGDIKGVNEGVVGALNNALQNGSLSPYTDPANIPSIIPVTPITPIPFPSPPKPYIPVPEEPTEPEDPIDPVKPTDPPIKPTEPFEGMTFVDLSRFFPFCIPFDFVELVKVLNVPPKEPVFEIPFEIKKFEFKYIFKIDFRDWAKYITFLRSIILIGFLFGLMRLTKHFIF